MAVDGVRLSKGAPQFLGGGAPATAADENAMMAWANGAVDRIVPAIADLPTVTEDSPLFTGKRIAVTSCPGAVFVYTGATWLMTGVAQFATQSDRLAAIAAPAVGMRAAIADKGWVEEYFTTASVAVAGWFPVSGKLPFVKLAMTAAQNTAGSGSNTPVTWDTEVSDVLAWHDTVTNPSRVTVAVAGRYRVKWKLAHRSATGTQLLSAQIRVTGALLARSLHTVPGSTTGFVYAQGDEVLDLAAGAYVEVAASSSAAQALEVTSSLFEVHYIGPA